MIRVIISLTILNHENALTHHTFKEIIFDVCGHGNMQKKRISTKRQPTPIYSKWSSQNRDKKVLSNDDLQDMNQTNFIRDIVMNGL